MQYLFGPDDKAMQTFQFIIDSLISAFDGTNTLIDDYDGMEHTHVNPQHEYYRNKMEPSWMIMMKPY